MQAAAESIPKGPNAKARNQAQPQKKQKTLSQPAQLNTPEQQGIKKATQWVAFLVGKMFYLASSYLRRGLPPNYCRRCCVSQPSSRWIGVGPQRHGHQDRHFPQVIPENCIGFLALPLTGQSNSSE